jgi:hypothetical protein
MAAFHSRYTRGYELRHVTKLFPSRFPAAVPTFLLTHVRHGIQKPQYVTASAP